MGLIQKIEQETTSQRTQPPPGAQVRVHVRIKEGDKERIQVFEGTVIAHRNRGLRSAFTVRKVSYGVGVERVFPLHSQAVDKIDVVSLGQVRRAKLYYLRNLSGKAARLKERGQIHAAAARVPVQSAE